jgi:hypothetical protein
MSKPELLKILGLLFLGLGFQSALARSKYAPEVVTLARSHQYFQNPQVLASGFWSLISYYIPQTTPGSCGSASLVMVLNAALALKDRFSEDAVITEKMLWKRVKPCLWGYDWKKCPKKTSGNYAGEHGVNLDQYASIARDAFEKYRMKSQVRAVHVLSRLALQEEVLSALKNLGPRFFLISNFNQKFFTQDTSVGHFAPVGAYDPSTRRVLILDPDRGSSNVSGYYEPYWVPLDLFLDAMATMDGSAFRGYLTIQVVT